MARTAPRSKAGSRVKPAPRSVGGLVALWLAALFAPVALGVLGIAVTTYRDTLERSDALMRARLDAAVVSRGETLERSALLARVAVRDLVNGADCDAWATAWNARAVWSTAIVRQGDDEVGCVFTPGGVDSARGLHALHSVPAGSVEAWLVGDAVTRAPGMESFVRRVSTDGAVTWLPTEAGAPPSWTPVSVPAMTPDTAWTADGRDGMRHRYVASPEGAMGAFTVLALPESLYHGVARQRLGATAGLLIALLALSLVVAWFGIERNLLRHVEMVRRVAGRLAGGEVDARVEVRGMPRELRDLARSVNHMAGRIARRTRQAEEALEAERALLRELHHRVKNNFQVIASLLAVQRRSLTGPDRARQSALLQYPQDRVAAMAIAYRVSYATGEIGDVPLDVLTDDVLAHIQTSVGLSAADMTGERAVADVEVDLDTAVPIALLLVETVVPMAREAARLGTDVQIDMLAGVAGLNVLLAGPAPALDADEETLSKRFVTAYLQQTGAQLDITRDGAFYRARIRIPVEKLKFTVLTAL